MYHCCSINLKMQSEHSGLRSDTSSLVKIDLQSVFYIKYKAMTSKVIEYLMTIAA